jgi:site-specific DNA-methyltransferase (adenine-specific)
MREVLPALGVTADCVLADPPYQSTSLEWDRWPEGWLEAAALVTDSLWCFGKLRTYLEHRDEFTANWKLSHDVIWEKHNGSGPATDRFNCVHEQAAHWYRGPWSEIYHEVPTTADATARQVRRKHKPPHWGEMRPGQYVSEDGGPRQMRSVISVRSMHGRAIHRTQKPVGLLAPMVIYACPPDGTVIDPFAGSGSALVTARMLGRRAVGIEADEAQCEKAARWLSQADLFSTAGTS